MADKNVYEPPRSEIKDRRKQTVVDRFYVSLLGSLPVILAFVLVILPEISWEAVAVLVGCSASFSGLAGMLVPSQSKRFYVPIAVASGIAYSIFFGALGG